MLLHPLHYTRDYILYLVASISTVGMVLVQEDDNDEEDVIYYLSKSLVGLEMCYSHVDRLSLTAIIVAQWFLHYILIPKTLIIVDFNPMYNILKRQLLGEKYSRWIILLL